MANICLRKHQQDAILTTIQNNFKSGVHSHATGTGKSLIGLHILKEYIIKNNNNNIWWICEQKSILQKFFNDEFVLKFINQLNITIINLLNFKGNFIDINKIKDRYLLISNRHFITYSKRYKLIDKSPSLLIHDECHSINNQSTKDLINYLENNNTKIIGFSATPLLVGPYKNILSSYSIYDAYLDNIILAPSIIWFNNTKNIDKNICELIKSLYYKKIIIWCGLIDHADNLKNEIKNNEFFKNFLIAIDTSKKEENLNDFYNCESNAILFCAAKHREGSDIKNLDCCIFMDLVQSRSSTMFIQSIGRVLRKDLHGKKTKGLIIDYKAKNVGEILSRIGKYIHTNDFPWDYKEIKLYGDLDNTTYFNLELINTSSIIKNNIELNTTRENIIKLFRRPIKDIYKERLDFELNLIEKKDLFSYLLQAVKILQLTEDIPHVTRGSCGSSLVCYLLKISNIDPIEHNIKFSRFLNNYRNNLPDIDFDFPHYKRDEVFIRISKKWPNQIARISNHIHFHRKSAEREVLREFGYNSFIGKYDVQKVINKLDKKTKEKFELKVKYLEGKFRTYSLHCGGIVFYPNGIPDEFILKSGLIDQVNFDKRHIAKEKNFKIDILSSKALSQLYYVDKSINFDNIIINPNVFDIFTSGNNIGITLAESPLIRKTFLMFKPKSIEDLAICLSVIRPIARESRYEGKVIGMIYDDDAIDLIKNYFKTDEDTADKLRREFSKYNFDSLKEYNKNYNLLPKELKHLGEYSFCKAHAMSYAQLIYKLAELKLNDPKIFWKSALKNCSSSYKKWVHPYEASKHDILQSNTEKSVFSKNDPFTHNKFKELFANSYFFKKINNNQEIYLFSGPIAHIRVLNISSKEKSIVSLIGIKNDYIEIITIGNFYFSPKAYYLTGMAKLDDPITKSYKAITFKYIVPEIK